MSKYINKPKVANKRLHIALLLDDSLDRPDGVQQYVITLGQWLTSQDHQVSYLAGQTKRTDLAGLYSMSRNVRVRFNGNRLSMPLPASRKKVRQVLSDSPVDVIHVMMPYSPLLAAKVIKQAADSAIVGTFHIAPYDKSAKFFSRLLASWLRKNTNLVQTVLSVSEPAQSFAKNTFSLPSTIVPNVINMSNFLPKTDSKTEDYIVFVGRLVKRKGCLELLKAYKLMQRRYHTKTRLIICGDGPDRNSLEAYCRHQKISGVEFKGQVSETQKKYYLASAKIAVFPSLGGESFGIVLLEAMAAGSQVVLAGNNEGYRSVISEVTESLVDPFNTDEFAEKLHRCLIDQQLINKLHKQQSRLVTKFDVNVVGPVIVDHYQRAIAKKAVSEA